MLNLAHIHTREKTMKPREMKRCNKTKTKRHSQQLQPAEAKYLKELQQREKFYCPNLRKKQSTFPFNHRGLFE
jgi:hypothetical protein